MERVGPINHRVGVGEAAKDRGRRKRHRAKRRQGHPVGPHGAKIVGRRLGDERDIRRVAAVVIRVDAIGVDEHERRVRRKIGVRKRLVDDPQAGDAIGHSRNGHGQRQEGSGNQRKTGARQERGGLDQQNLGDGVGVGIGHHIVDIVAVDLGLERIGRQGDGLRDVGRVADAIGINRRIEVIRAEIIRVETVGIGLRQAHHVHEHPPLGTAGAGHGDAGAVRKAADVALHGAAVLPDGRQRVQLADQIEALGELKGPGRNGGGERRRLIPVQGHRAGITVPTADGNVISLARHHRKTKSALVAGGAKPLVIRTHQRQIGAAKIVRRGIDRQHRVKVAVDRVKRDRAIGGSDPLIPDGSTNQRRPGIIRVHRVRFARFQRGQVIRPVRRAGQARDDLGAGKGVIGHLRTRSLRLQAQPGNECQHKPEEPLRAAQGGTVKFRIRFVHNICSSAAGG